MKAVQLLRIIRSLMTRYAEMEATPTECYDALSTAYRRIYGHPFEPIDFNQFGDPEIRGFVQLISLDIPTALR